MRQRTVAQVYEGTERLWQAQILEVCEIMDELHDTTRDDIIIKMTIYNNIEEYVEHICLSSLFLLIL